MFPPLLHCIHTKSLGKHELFDNTFNKGIQISLLKHIFIINISSLVFNAHSWPSSSFFLFTACAKSSITTTKSNCYSWLVVWFTFALWPFLLLSFAPTQGITENYALNFWISIWHHLGNSYLNLLLNTNYELRFSSTYILKTDSKCYQTLQKLQQHSVIIWKGKKAGYINHTFNEGQTIPWFSVNSNIQTPPVRAPLKSLYILVANCTVIPELFDVLHSNQCRQTYREWKEDSLSHFVHNPFLSL